jgi:uncharacterized protein (DUF697 family)
MTRQMKRPNRSMLFSQHNTVIGNINQFWRLTRELDVNGVRQAFERPVCISVLGSDSAIAERVARLIEPDPEAGEVTAGVLGDPTREHANAYIAAIDGPLSPTARRALSELSVGDEPLLVVQTEDEEAGAGRMLILGVAAERIITLGSADADEDVRDRLFKALVAAAPEVMLAAGRRHPLLRERVAEYLIRDTSRVNAQFAALSSLPSTIPIIGGLVGDMADLLVLTKNQVLMLFKLAGLYGSDLELGRELVFEVLPVVGGAFVWRSTARVLVGMLPAMLGLVPKTLVAYSGTYVVGQSARYYFRYGRRPPPELVRDLRSEAARLAEQTLARLPRR